MRVMTAFQRYREARMTLLSELQLQRSSNRDPLSEFSEWLVVHLVHGTLAGSPVQKGWDVRAPDGDRIQVKYLANATGHWVNEHPIWVNDEMDRYAVVIIEELQPQTVIVFPTRGLEAVAQALGKRNPNQHIHFDLTQTNYQRILADPALFQALGVQVYRLA